MFIPPALSWPRFLAPNGVGSDATSRECYCGAITLSS